MDEFGAMAGVRMPEWAIARAMGRRGTAHCFAELEAGRTALVVIDLQLAYMDVRGGYTACAAARETVTVVNRLARVLREAGGLVVWVQNTHDESCLREWTVQQRMNTGGEQCATECGVDGGVGGACALA